MGLFAKLFPGAARVAELERRVTALERETDLLELENLRTSVLKALRSLRRTEQAQDARREADEGSGGTDAITRAVLARRRGNGHVQAGG